MDIQDKHIIVFDGICNLCNGSVRFILRHEKDSLFQFAALQSETGKSLLAWCGLPESFADAVIYIANGRAYLGSTAALQIGRRLKFPWSMISSLGLRFPEIVRGWVYRQIAAYRYQWFGKQELCMVPTKELRARFLD